MPPTRAGQADLQAAVEQLQAAAATFGSDTAVTDGSDVDKAQRVAVVAAANAVLAAVKTPADQWVDMFTNVTLYGASRLAWEWGLYEALPDDGRPARLADLAVQLDVEDKLLVRVAGVLVTLGVLARPAAGQVAHTERSRFFTEKQSRLGGVTQMTWDNGFVVYARLPEYFRKYGKKEPQTPTHVPITFAYDRPDLNFYELLATDPARLQRFLVSMAAVEERMPIAGLYDFSWAVDCAAADEVGGDNARALFVDVGGGGGQAIKALRAEFPGLGPLNRFVLQDRPEVLEAGIQLDDPLLRGIQRVPVDFHKEQPIKGAHIFWIRRCLHNYGDTVATNMLRIIAEAMAPDSRLLLEEDVLDDPPSLMAGNLDFMMLGFGGKQRTLPLWTDITASVGLQITNVSRGKGPWHGLAVIECRKG